MSILSNRRREIFSQAVACGNSLRSAACVAGYSPARAQVTGSNLGKDRKVAARICELRAALAESITRNMTYGVLEAMTEATEAFELARKNGQPGHMVAAITLKAKLAGLLVERRQIDYRNIDELTDTELETLIVSAESSSDTGFTH